MNRLNRGFVILILTILIVSVLVFTGTARSYVSVDRIMNPKMHELYQHAVMLRADNDIFFMELESYLHHPEELHYLEMREALDRMSGLLDLLEDTASLVGGSEELILLYSSLREQLTVLTVLAEEPPLREQPGRLEEMRKAFGSYSEGTWNLLLDTDRLVKSSFEESLRTYRLNELRVMITSFVLILAVFSLVILLQRHRMNLLKLKRNEHKLRVVLDSVDSIVLSIDSEFRINSGNRMAGEAWGNGGNILGTELYKAFPDLPLERKEIEDCIVSRRILRDEYKSGISGEKRSEIIVYPLSDDSAPGAVIIIADRSEQSRMKELIAQNEKMLSVGGLAAGMAHEINNPLAGMIQTAAVIKSRLTDRDLKGNIRAAEECSLDMNVLEAYLEKRHINSLFDGMNESGEQATAIVGNMLDFVRRDSSAVSTQDMVTLVERSLELAATDYDMKTYLYFDKFAIFREFDEDLPLIPCSASRIQQVILNILRNGAEAMVIPRKGPPDGSHFILRLIKNDLRIRLEIEDNGPGMDEEISKRIFEPFFTTKGIGQGTGLGLSVAYFIISENHNGLIRVESVPGKGTNFIIELPLAVEEN